MIALAGLRPTTRRRACRAAVLLALLLSIVPRAGAQRPDSARVVPPRADTAGPRTDAGRVGVGPGRVLTRRDSLLKPPISPRRALLTSFLVPGLAQSRLGRNKARLLFGAFEVTSIIMARTTADRLRAAKEARGAVPDSALVFESLDPLASSPLGFVRGGSRVQTNLAGRVGARRGQFEDWMALLVFNHLAAGADAFVAAQLWDLPTQVQTSRVELAPGGPVETRVTVALRWTLP